MMNEIKHLKEINGKAIYHLDGFEQEAPTSGIRVMHHIDTIEFPMLTKPASEGGDLNRCQWSDLVNMGLEMLKYLNNKYPCRENSLTITKLEEALMWDEARTKNRVFCADCDDDIGNIKDLLKQNKIMREALELMLSSDHYPIEHYYGEMYTNAARQALEKVKELEK